MKPKFIDFPNPELKVTYDYGENQIKLSTETFAYYVYIALDTDYTFRVSENFFDLTPGWEVTVKVLSNHSLKDI